MQLVVDANILFSALITDGFTAELLFEEELKLYTAEFIIEEFLKYKDEILKKSKRSPESFSSFMHALQEIITVIPQEEYETHIQEAKEISPDKRDAAYFALALKLRCAIWSNDKLLKEQEAVKVFFTSEVKLLV
jgi:predicted nucleic acid-binding protein